MSGLGFDIRCALRTLTRTPGFTAVAILSVAIAIGANTSVFSLVNAIHLRPLEFPDPGSLVDVHETSSTRLCAGCGIGTSYPGFRDWDARARAFTGLAAYREWTFVLSASGDERQAERVNAGLASHDLFPLLGVRPIIGRGFLPDEDQPGASPVALLGHGIWQRRFQGDTAIVGRTVRLSGTRYFVVGVMPPGFKFPETAELWVPLAPLAHRDARGDRELGVVGRLRPDVSIGQADAEMRGIARALSEAHPETQAAWSAGVTSLQKARAGETGNAFLILLGAVSFVLLIACANLASFFLARVTARTREMTVRAAIGASRGRLVRLVMMESLLVAFAGGALGMLLALWGSRAAVRQIAEPIPYYIRFDIDWRVGAFCLVASLAAGLLFGIIPALRASRSDLVQGLREGAPGAGGPARGRLVRGLVVLELALALMLLSGAGVLVRTFLRVTRPPAGLDAERVLQGELTFLGTRFEDPAQVSLLVDEIVARLERVPGVRAGISRWHFLAGFGAEDRRIAVEGADIVPEGVSPRFASAVTPSWLAVQGERLVHGRGITVADAPGTEPVVVVNEALARRLWPDGSPVGRRIKLGPEGPWAEWRTIVGVVAGQPTEPNGRPAPSYAWIPFAQSPSGGTVELSLRAPGDPRALAPVVRAEVRAADPDVAVEQLQTAAQALARRYWPVRFFATLFAAFAAFAVLLASIGTYGVLAHAVSQRTREIGVRLALGADRSMVVRMVLREGATLGVLGLAIGLAGAAALARVIRAVLFGASPHDPVVGAVVAVLFGVVVLVATWLPARRAAAVEPLMALRTE